MLCDVYDGQEWIEGTVFSTEMRRYYDGRIIPMCHVGYRVYRDHGNKLKRDARGFYVGYGAKYDESVPLYSPYIAKYQTRSVTGGDVVRKLDTELDDHIKPQPGFERVFACPRIYSCISKKFLYFMDKFGNRGGFDLLLDVMENGVLGENGLDLTCIGYMITLISMPVKLWHKSFI